jgi:hypothetical protein
MRLERTLPTRRHLNCARQRTRGHPSGKEQQESPPPLAVPRPPLAWAAWPLPAPLLGCRLSPLAPWQTWSSTRPLVL